MRGNAVPYIKHQQGKPMKQKKLIQAVVTVACCFIPDPVTSLLVNIAAEIAIDFYYRKR